MHDHEHQPDDIPAGEQHGGQDQPPPPPPAGSSGNPPQPPPPQDYRYSSPPPPPMPYPAANSANVLKILGIVCLSGIAAIGGLFGACFAIVSVGDASMVPWMLGGFLVFIAAAVAIFQLVRPRRR